MINLTAIPWNLIWPLLVVQLILMGIALTDVIRHQRTNGPFILWIFIIIFLNIVGPILYFIFGRRQA